MSHARFILTLNDVHLWETEKKGSKSCKCKFAINNEFGHHLLSESLLPRGMTCGICKAFFKGGNMSFPCNLIASDQKSNGSDFLFWQ